MPSWSIHLAIAKKINEYLNLKKDLFYFGNLIPDTNKNCKLNRYEAHYYNKKLPFINCPSKEMIDIDRFLKDYKKCIANPLILGYYAHLLADNYYNNIVYSKCWICDNRNNIIGIRFKNNVVKQIDINDRTHQKKKYKHKDFELYGKYLFNNKDLNVPTDKKEIIKKIKYLKNRFLTDEDVNNRIDYLNNQFKYTNKLTILEKLFKHKYKLFTKEEFDTIFNDCCNYVLKKLEKYKTKV